ncbi:MAG: hypothetical protein ACRDNE_04770, partial [Gaiellaceae bacterium]
MDDGHPLRLTIEELDRDGALLEAIGAVAGSTRAEFLRRAAIGSGALLAALAAPGAAPAARSKAQDTAILNYGLAFEYLQSG